MCHDRRKKCRSQEMHFWHITYARQVYGEFDLAKFTFHSLGFPFFLLYLSVALVNSFMMAVSVAD
uniref:Splicing factor 3A subunit n=1 Tax=Solanum tuberosum TaxID=4113 RepID=M0ZX30_SOLTU